MAKDGKQESRKTAWRGISVKTDIQPTSPVTINPGKASISWERPLSPLSHCEHNAGVETVNEKLQTGGTQLHQEQSSTTPTVAVSPSTSTAVSSTNSSSKSSSKHKKEKLAGLGSLTKTSDLHSTHSSSTAPKQKSSKRGRSLTLGSLTKSNDGNDKRAQKERERKERKEQEKLEKERKEQRKKELKLAKEMERKERKSRTSSFLFSRSSKSSGPSTTTIHTTSNSITEEKPKSPVERRSILSFGRHSLASLTSRPSNASTTEIVTPEPPMDDAVNDESSSDDFVDFVDSQMSIHSDKSSKVSTTMPEQNTTSTQLQGARVLEASSLTQQTVPSSVDQQPQTGASRLLNHLQHQAHFHSSPYQSNSGYSGSTSSIASSNSKTSHSTTPVNTNHSMLYILNSLQDAGRNFEDDDLLDDQTVNKIEKQEQHRTSNSHQLDDSQSERHFDQHIQSLEIVIKHSATLPDPKSQDSTQRPAINRLSVRSSHGASSSQQQLLSPSSTGELPTSPTISHRSSTSNSSYDTVSQADTLYSPSVNESQQQRHSTGTSPCETTDNPGEQHATVKTTPNSPVSGPMMVEVTKKAEQNDPVLLDDLISDKIKMDHHCNIDADKISTDENNVEQQFGLDEEQKAPDHCNSIYMLDTPNTTSHLPTEEIKNHHQPHNKSADNSAESLNIHATEQDRSVDIISNLSSATTPTIDTGGTVGTQKLPKDQGTEDSEGYDSHGDTGNVENKHNGPTKVIKQAVNSVGQNDTPTDAIQQQQVDHDSNGQYGVITATTNTELPLLSENAIAQTKTDPNSTKVDILGHESTMTISACLSPPTELIADNVTNQHTPSTSDEETKPTSPMEAAAAVTASKRSTFLSRRWSAATSPAHPSTEQKEQQPPPPPPQQRPAFEDLPISTSTIYANANIEPENGVAPNFLTPREQEEADQPIRQGMNYLFGNKFTKAMSIFKLKAESEPLHALGLGSMLFLKAMMTYNEGDINAAMDSLTHSYSIAGIQADLSEEKRSFDDTFSLQFSSLFTDPTDGDGRNSAKTFKTNGVLRAHVIKAESSLLMGILQLAQENMTGYLKSGLNLKKACASYNLVWNEYQNMGDQVSKWMDEDTVSGLQFGVGTLHLLLSCLPEKIVKMLSGLAWKTDRTLGLTLLNSVMSGKGTRSSFASLILLSYYSLLSSAVPSLYAQESIQPTIECLVAAQKSHPKSCFFLYYAARISRVARNVGLSTQSFTMATSSTRRGAWAEVAMKHTVAYEVGLNHAMQLDWDTSAAYFEQLCCARDWSPAFCQYFVGACHEMQGQRQEAINIFNEVPVLSRQQHHRKSLLDNYVQNKVEKHQHQNYSDLDNSLPGLELLLLLNAFASMEDTYLQRCLLIIQETYEPIKLDGIYGLDIDGYRDDCNGIGKHGIISKMACYCTLLLLKSSVLNALSRYNDCVADLEWILNQKHHLENEGWLLPFVYYESGISHWGIGNQQKSRDLWQVALSFTNHDFEIRMASRIHLAIAKCDQLGVMDSSKADTSAWKRFSNQKFN